MKSLSYEIRLPAVFIAVDDKNLLVPSMVLSTIMACFLITFIPQLTPIWMQFASSTPK